MRRTVAKGKAIENRTVGAMETGTAKPGVLS
jgi:hypothetical protein